MTLIYISLGLAIVTAVALFMANRSLTARLNDAEGFIEEQNRKLEEYVDKEDAYEAAFLSKAEVEERESPIPCFVIYRMGRNRAVDVLRVGFNPDDPDDKEYRRIHVQEIADKLNDKP